MYDGAMLAVTANVVVVTVNYRLGIFGFLNQTHLKTGANANDDSGDFAILDVVKALKFVNANIAAFGGDPTKVTLMGQSAGAVDVYAVMVSPLVVNANPTLVHRLVPISGGLSLASELPPGSIATLAPATAYQAQGDLLLLNMLVADGTAADIKPRQQAYVATLSDAQIAAYLRSKIAERAADDGADEARADRRLGLQWPDPRGHGAAGRPGRRDQRLRQLPEGAGDGRAAHPRRGQAVSRPSSPTLASARRRQRGGC